MKRDGKYIYCIIATDDAQNFGPIGIGGRGDEVYNICSDGLSAVISNAPWDKVVISPDNLLSHEGVIEEVMKEYTVLPMRFSTVAESADDILFFLKKNARKLMGLIKDLDNKVEFGLKVSWRDIKSIYGEIAASDEDIKSMRAKGGGESDMVAVGRKVERALVRKRDEEAEPIVYALRKLAYDYKTVSVKDPNIVLQANFLVDRSWMLDFGDAVANLKEKSGDRFEVRVTRPLPPYNFVNIGLDA